MSASGQEQSDMNEQVFRKYLLVEKNEFPKVETKDLFVVKSNR
jgi:hypothetical protein